MQTTTWLIPGIIIILAIVVVIIGLKLVNTRSCKCNDPNCDCHVQGKGYIKSLDEEEEDDYYKTRE